jgi:SagB-type dehydrogenase family enzyme
MSNFVVERLLREAVDSVDSPVGKKLNFSESPGLIYHENSKLHPLSLRMLGMSIDNFETPHFTQRAIQPYKVYPGATLFSMDAYRQTDNPTADLLTTIVNRRSVRCFEPGPATLKQLFYLLHYAYGITNATPMEQPKDGAWAMRVVPSAGGLFPLEVYVLLLDAGELPGGLYHYRPDVNGLELIKAGNFRELMRQKIQAEPYVDLTNAAGVVFVTSLFERIMTKYRERGYRFLLKEVGALSQQMNLMAEAINLGMCWIGSYLDDELHEFIGVDGLTECVQNVMVYGKKDQD